jgi:hypothetical protein
MAFSGSKLYWSANPWAASNRRVGYAGGMLTQWVMTSVGAVAALAQNGGTPKFDPRLTIHTLVRENPGGA